MEHVQYIQELIYGFYGFSLEYRGRGTNWPDVWRVRLVTAKNERNEYRVECFGCTAQDAIEKLRTVIANIDES